MTCEYGGFGVGFGFEFGLEFGFGFGFGFEFKFEVELAWVELNALEDFLGGVVHALFAPGPGSYVAVEQHLTS